VLVLAHLLAPLLDHRTHEEEDLRNAPGADGGRGSTYPLP